MPSISAATSVYAAARDSSSAAHAKSSARSASANREAELARQLDERLSGQLSRIRQQIGPAKDAGTTSREGTGGVLDIRA
ncbi:MAG TPA: hypothetical protein VFB38_06510 [Chthonomonadaceae bacterium]|nr:hypothetical protein [Chthonomonadaceae bacterium]